MTGIGTVSRPRAMLDLYRDNARTAMAYLFQYPTGNVIMMVGFLAEAAVYLAVWTAIAQTRGGEVGGYTAGSLASYFIVWTLVRNMNIAFTPYGFEWRIQSGQFSGQLLRPAHPIHYDLSYFAGWKIVSIVLWLPVAALLFLAFRPDLSPTWTEIGVFVVAIWGAYVLRSLMLWTLGLITFFTTRVAALFELFMVFELLLSGRLVPMSLMPQWVRTVSDYTPFKWTFGYPIESLVGDMSTTQLLGGLGMQLFWIGMCAGLLALTWKAAVRRYSAVGN